MRFSPISIEYNLPLYMSIICLSRAYLVPILNFLDYKSVYQLYSSLTAVPTSLLLLKYKYIP
jgi:hypothetical protein